jgi:hypothetical protein
MTSTAMPMMIARNGRIRPHVREWLDVLEVVSISFMV